MDRVSDAVHPSGFLRWEPQSPVQRAMWAACLLGCIAAVAFVAMKDPRTLGRGVMCPSLRGCGIYCPGCGSTRAAHDLLQGNLGLAWRDNPAFVVAGIPAGLYLVLGAGCAVATGKRPRVRISPRTGYAIAALLTVYTVLRNVPGPGFDALRPPEAVSVPVPPQPPR